MALILRQKILSLSNFNYRMGPFGFLAHPELDAECGHKASGNYGLPDQIPALTFMQSEIAAFGGDSDHITVGGQSGMYLFFTLDSFNTELQTWEPTANLFSL
jgi:carboxylesterase type B